LNLKCDIVVSKIAFKFNLYRYGVAILHSHKLLTLAGLFFSLRHVDIFGAVMLAGLVILTLSLKTSVGVGYFALVKTPIDDSQHGPCNQSDPRE
jgi:hypothetical protein